MYVDVGHVGGTGELSWSSCTVFEGISCCCNHEFDASWSIAYLFWYC